MNKFYPLATLLSAILLTLGAQAQTYTTVRDGNWNASGPAQVWDVSGQPPANCTGCTITVLHQVHLNAHLTLSGGSVLNISGPTAQLIVDSSGGNDWSNSFNVVLMNDHSNPVNSIMATTGGIADARGADTAFDGLFSTFNGSPLIYFKQVGRGPAAFSGTVIANNGNPPTALMNSGSTLKATGTLPLGLTNFDAVPNNGAVDLTWTTQFEQNASYFDIERSANNGTKWDVVGKVTAIGNSNKPTSYSFTDNNPGSGTLQYRIHGYDLDAHPTYSSIRAVRLNPLATISVFPNPAKDYVNVSFPATDGASGLTSIRLIGQSGQVLAEKRVSGSGGSIVTFPVASYAPGNYLLQIVTADGAKQINKVLISRN